MESNVINSEEVLGQDDVGKPKIYSRYKITQSSENRVEKKPLQKGCLEIIKECDFCQKTIKKSKKPLICKCKETFFCSHDCQQTSPHFKYCQKRMSPVKIRLNDMIATANRSTAEEDEEETRHVREIISDLYQRAEHPGGIERLAKEGDPVAAWHVGCGFSNRIAASATMRSINAGCMPKEYLKKSFGETDEIAIKYFEVSAKGGLKEGMFSLAHKMFQTSSLKIDQRVACYWMAKAHTAGCKEAMAILDNEMMLIRDVEALSIQMEMSVEQISHFGGRNLVASGPNLGSLLAATRLSEVVHWNGMTFKGPGNPFYGYTEFKKLNEMTKSLDFEIEVYYP